MILTEGDFHVYSIPFTGDIRGATVVGEDNFYSIYLNSNLPQEVQKKTLEHEIRHIINNDFFNGKSIDDIECE